MNLKLFGGSILVLAAALCHYAAADDVVLRTIKSDGYVPELYKVLTPDDYVLRVLRVRSAARPVKFRGVVFMMHCLLCSCGCYIAAGRNQSLAYNFVDRGYDVWLGNARGTRWTAHRTLTRRDVKFWDYSLDEIGGIDVPSMIDFVLKSTKSRQLHYVGHSMGGATFMVLMATYPEYSSRIKSAYLMAPAMSVGNSSSELLRTVVASFELIKGTFDGLNYQYFPIDQTLLNSIEAEVRKRPLLNILVEWLYYNLVGHDSGLTNRKRLIPLVKLLLDIMSVNQLLHFHQFYVSSDFRKYDYYDPNRNLKKYGTVIPPLYNITRLPETLVTFFGTGDALVTPQNSRNFLSKVKVTKNYYLDRWNHLDFQYSKTMRTTIFNRIIKYVEM